jgi:hypothetical protein
MAISFQHLAIGILSEINIRNNKSQSLTESRQLIGEG